MKTNINQQLSNLIQAYQNSSKTSTHGAIRYKNQYGLQAFSEVVNGRFNIIVCLLNADKDLVISYTNKGIIQKSYFAQNPDKDNQILNIIIPKLIDNLSDNHSRPFSNKGKLGYYPQKLNSKHNYGEQSKENFDFVVRNKIISKIAREMAERNKITYHRKGFSADPQSVDQVKRYNFKDGYYKEFRDLYFLDLLNLK